MNNISVIIKKAIVLIALFSGFVINIYSQHSVKLWDLDKPKIENGFSDEAELIVYLPESSNSKKHPAILICPGGGYAGISMEYEGHAFAKWIAFQGFVGAILKYRLPNQHKEVPFEDAEKAISIIQSNSEQWSIDTEKIGIAGFSAGGHLAAVLSNNKSSFTPFFTILFYPVITLQEVTKGGTRNNLMGLNPSAEDVYEFSAEMQVSEQTPPTIIFTCDGDESVPSMHSVKYYESLKTNNIPAALYIYPEKGHGWAMLKQFRYNDITLELLGNWLQQFR